MHKFSSKETGRIRRVIIGIFPHVKNYKPAWGCTFGDQCQFRHTEGDGQPRVKSRRNGWKRISCFTEGVSSIGWDQITPSHSQMAHGTTFCFGKEKVHRKEFCRSANLKNAIRVRQNLRTGHFRKPCSKNDTPSEKHRAWRKNVYKLKKMRIFLRSALWVMPAPSSRKPEEREFGVDSGASIFMLSRKIGILLKWRRFENPGTPPR